MNWFQQYCGVAATIPSGKPPWRCVRLPAVLGRRSVSMVRELQLLTVGFVFAFLGAIVMGVF
jgi:hypothetical protein